ncbi:MAG: hypothetical protein LBK25_08320 [Treponema sp.]|nr:hypothetical protein [Treponema sp.]
MSKEERRDVRRCQTTWRFRLLASAPCGCFKVIRFALPANKEQAPLACKRSRQDGVSGTTFRTTTIVKYVTPRRVPA